MTRWAKWAVVAALLTGCTAPNPAFDPDPFLPGECRSGVETTEVVADFERPELLDVLFVVDSSGDVEQLQLALSRSMVQFTTLIERIDLDAKIAVATTDASGTVELAAAGTTAEGCVDNDTAVVSSSDPNGGEALRCNVVQGGEGNGFDQSLRVVDELLGAGAGTQFFREGSRLLVIVVTKDDDCSSQATLSGIPREVCPTSNDLVDVDAMVDGWIEARLAPESIGLAVFGGPPSDEERGLGRPVCSSTLGSVFPANRLHRAVSRFGDFGFFNSACTDDFSQPLAAIVESFVGEAVATLCPADLLAHEPLSVVVERDGEQESLEPGASGFVYLGSTERCPNGGIRFAGATLRGAEQITLEYCTIPTN